ncbi:MAG: hypothetical protein ACREF0_19060 [Acetobacteraceae bacterium]
MSRVLSAALAGALVLGCSVAALATPQKTRVRGTIESISGDQLVIKTYTDKTADLALGQNTKFISVLPASLSDIRSGDFVGIGATGPESKIVAMEVVIFPNSMRGSGEGHYPWSVPAAVADADMHKGESGAAGAPAVQGTMTNGTVASTTGAAAAPASGAPAVQGTMTNGTVASTAGAGNTANSKSGGQELTVTYGHGGKVQILVPANTPIVRLQPAERSILEPGAKAFAVATAAQSGPSTASFVAVGKNGLMPPM